MTEAATPPEEARRPSRVRRFAVRAGAAFALFVLAGAALSQTRWGSERIRGLVADGIMDATGLQPELGAIRVELGVFPPRAVAVVDGLSLEHPEHGSLATAEQIRVRPSLGSLLVGQFDLDRITLVGPVVRLVVRDGTIANLPTIASSDEESELPFRELRITRGSVIVEGDAPVTGHMDALYAGVIVRDGGGLTVHVDAHAGELTHALGADALERLHLSGTVHPERGALVEHFVLRVGDARVALEDADVPLPFRGEYRGSASIDFPLARLAEAPADLELPDIGGDLHIRSTLEGRPGHVFPEGELIVSLERGRIGNKGLGDLLEVHGSVEDGVLSLEEGSRMVIHEAGGEAHLGGTIGLEAPYRADISLDIRRLALAHLMDQLDVTDNCLAWWVLGGRARLRGSIWPLDLRGRLDARSHEFMVTATGFRARPRQRIISVDRATIHTDVRIDIDALRFQNLELDTGRSQARVDVHIGFSDRIRVVADFSRLDAGELSPLADIPIGGVGTAHVEVGPTYSDVHVDGHAAIENFTFDEFRLGSLRTRFDLVGDYQAIDFSGAEIDKGETRVRADQMLIDFRDDRFEMTARLHAERLHLRDLYHAALLDTDPRFDDYQAQGSGDVNVRFTQDFPHDGPTGTVVADMDLDIREADLGGYHFTGGQLEGRWTWHDIDASIEGGVLELDHLNLEKGRGTVAIGGTMDRGQLFMNVAADRIEIQDTEGLNEGMPELEGHYAILGVLRDAYDAPHAELDLNLTDVTYMDAPLGQARAYVRLTDRRDPWVREALAWDQDAPPEDAPCAHARLGFARGRWRADPPILLPEGPVPALPRPMAFLVCGEGFGGGEVDLAAGWTDTMPLRGRMALTNFSLTEMADAMLGPEAGVRGRLSGEVLLRGGDLLRDESLTGTLRVDTLEASVGEVSLANPEPIEVSFRQGRAEIGQAAVVGPGTRVRLRGGGTLARLDVGVDTRVDLGLMARASDDLEEADGVLRARMRVRGPVDDPAVFGQARLRARTIRAGALPAPLRDVRAQVTFSERRLELDRFDASLGGGTLSIGGEARFAQAGLSRYSFDIDMNRVHLRPMEGADLGFDARLAMSWQRGMRLPRLGGELAIDRARYTRPIHLSPSLGELYRPQRESVEDYDPARDTMELDVRVVQTRPLRIRNNLMDVDLRIEDAETPFRIVGTDQRPGVLGSIVIPQGTVRFRNADFAVREGRIDFHDRLRINPSFDISASTTIQRNASDLTAASWQILLRAYGDLDGFRLDARSIPELTQQDIVLLLTIGLTTSEAANLQAGDLSSTALEALSAISGVEDEVSSALRVIDEIGITTFYHPVTNRPEPQVTITRRISDRVRISASTGLTGEEREVRAGAEWRLSDQTSLQLSYDNINRQTASSVGNVGLDLHWRLEFE